MSSAVVTEKGDFQRFGMARCRIAALRNECQYANWRTFHKVRFGCIAKRADVATLFHICQDFVVFIFARLFFQLIVFYLWCIIIFFFFLSKCIFRKTMPSQIAELNVHFGVFLGGLGDFSESYLSTVDNFRGCMSDVNAHFFHFFFFAVWLEAAPAWHVSVGVVLFLVNEWLSCLIRLILWRFNLLTVLPADNFFFQIQLIIGRWNLFYLIFFCLEIYLMVLFVIWGFW